MSDQVNPQITDAITQANVKVVGEAPAHSVAIVYQTLAQSVSLAMQAAQANQAGLQQIGNAIVASAVAHIMKQAP